MEVSSHALSLGRVDGRAVRGRRVHQPLARPPRLPPDHGGLLRSQGQAVRSGIAVACADRGDLRRRRRGPRDGRQGGLGAITVSATRRVGQADWTVGDFDALAQWRTGIHRCRSGRSAPPHRYPATWRLQHRQLPARAGHPGFDRGGTRAGGTRAGRRAGARAAGDPSSAVRISWRWSTTRTSPAPCSAVLETLRGQTTPSGSPWCSVPVVTAIPASGPDGRDRGRTWPISWSSPTTTRVTRNRKRSAPPSWRGRRVVGGRGRRDR